MEIEQHNPIEIKISGDEKSAFLQGLITSNIETISESMESFILTPQGKIKHQIKITDHKEYYLLLCTNDQNDLLSYLTNYARLSKVTIDHVKLNKEQFDKKYFLNNLRQGKIDCNFLKQPTLYPSEVDDNLVDYTKGCYVGQEVVSRMKHKQKNKKVIKIYNSEQLKSTHLPTSHKIMLEIDDYVIIKQPVE
jgi:folate-binding protein YgfZ